MKLKISVLVLMMVLLCVALPASAQQPTVNTVTFNGFSFSFDSLLATSVNISQYAGDAPDLEQPGGPDAPHTQFALYTDPPAPQALFDSTALIRLYRTVDLISYPFYQEDFEQLQTLLTDRPDLAQFMVYAEDGSTTELPYLPSMPASQVIRARAQYVDTGAVSGIRYVTVFRQDASPFVNSEFVYTFQELSADGTYYVTAIFRLTTDLFPETIGTDFDMDAFIATIGDYMTQSIEQLNTATPENFAPSLTMLDAVVQSFAFVPSGELVSPIPPTTDPTLGGLAGVTWTLVSYGAPDAPLAALPDVPVTIVFDETGLGGSSGCNSYGGIFQYLDGTITVSEVIGTLMACEEPIMAQEMAYLAALETVSSYTITEGQLQIFYEGGVLTFAGVPIE